MAWSKKSSVVARTSTSTYGWRLSLTVSRKDDNTTQQSTFSAICKVEKALTSYGEQQHSKIKAFSNGNYNFWAWSHDGSNPPWQTYSYRVGDPDSHPPALENTIVDKTWTQAYGTTAQCQVWFKIGPQGTIPGETSVHITGMDTPPAKSKPSTPTISCSPSATNSARGTNYNITVTPKKNGSGTYKGIELQSGANFESWGYEKGAKPSGQNSISISLDHNFINSKFSKNSGQYQFRARQYNTHYGDNYSDWSSTYNIQIPVSKKPQLKGIEYQADLEDAFHGKIVFDPPFVDTAAGAELEQLKVIINKDQPTERTYIKNKTDFLNDDYSIVIDVVPSQGYTYNGYAIDSYQQESPIEQGFGNFIAFVEDQAKLWYKINSQWQLGKVWYKNAGTWQKVKKAYIKNNNEWHKV